MVLGVGGVGDRGREAGEGVSRGCAGGVLGRQVGVSSGGGLRGE